MSEYFFGLGSGWLPKRADAIARKHGAELVNYTDAQCQCGHGCSPHTCKRSRRHWFSTDNLGEPHDSTVRKNVMSALDRAGVIK